MLVKHLCTFKKCQNTKNGVYNFLYLSMDKYQVNLIPNTILYSNYRFYNNLNIVKNCINKYESDNFLKNKKLLCTQNDLPVEPKKSLKQRLIDEFIHYKNGTKLFCLDVKLCSRYIRRVLNGKTLSVREKLQLKRTIVDIFRLVPFLALVLIPFAEFALPFIVKIFPGFLPSTFHGHHPLRQKLIMDLEYRSTMYAEIGKYHYAKNDTLSRSFAKLMDEVRAGRRKITSNDLLRYSKYMTEDDIADILTSEELQGILRTVWVKKDSKVDPEYLDELTQDKLDEIEKSDNELDAMVNYGFKNVTRDELVKNCEIRGLVHSFFSDELLKQKLHRWVHYRIKHNVPVLFMLLTRLAESDDPMFITNAFKALPDRIVKELEINIATDEGEKLSHKTMYDIIKKEEELIEQEHLELSTNTDENISKVDSVDDSKEFKDKK